MNSWGEFLLRFVLTIPLGIAGAYIGLELSESMLMSWWSGALTAFCIMAVYS